MSTRADRSSKDGNSGEEDKCPQHTRLSPLNSNNENQSEFNTGENGLIFIKTQPKISPSDPPPKDVKGRTGTWDNQKKAWYFARGRGVAPNGSDGLKMNWDMERGEWHE